MNIRAIIGSMVVVAAALMPAVAIAEDIFSALTANPQVESTYVSGRFSHNMQQWRTRNGSHGIDLSRGFSQLFSYQCYSEESVDAARKILADYLKANPSMEVVMRQTQGLMEYVVYEQFLDDDTIEKLIIWSSDSPNMCDIVVVYWEGGMARNNQ